MMSREELEIMFGRVVVAFSDLFCYTHSHTYRENLYPVFLLLLQKSLSNIIEQVLRYKSIPRTALPYFPRNGLKLEFEEELDAIIRAEKKMKTNIAFTDNPSQQPEPDLTTYLGVLENQSTIVSEEYIEGKDLTLSELHEKVKNLLKNDSQNQESKREDSITVSQSASRITASTMKEIIQRLNGRQVTIPSHTNNTSPDNTAHGSDFEDMSSSEEENDESDSSVHRLLGLTDLYRRINPGKDMVTSDSSDESIESEIDSASENEQNDSAREAINYMMDQERRIAGAKGIEDVAFIIVDIYQRGNISKSVADELLHHLRLAHIAMIGRPKRSSILYSSRSTLESEESEDD